MTDDSSARNISAVVLPVGNSRLTLFQPTRSRGWAWAEILHDGHRLILGGDDAKDMRANYLAGLDELGEHRQMSSDGYSELLGPSCFYFQGMASTSAIYAAYLPDDVLRLIVQGSQPNHDLEVVLDLSPGDRAEWRRRITAWRIVPRWGKPPNRAERILRAIRQAWSSRR